jgi:hypothetical protein
MKHVLALCALALIAGLVACSSAAKVTLPAVEPSEVEVFMPEQYPDEDYKILKTVTITDIISADDRDMVVAAREQAAQLGADALLIKSLRMTSAGVGLEEANASRDQKILEALAVYFPSRHPELEEQQGGGGL